MGEEKKVKEMDDKTPLRIQIEARDSKKGFYTLLTNGAVVVERDNKYVIPKYCLSILRKEGIDFKQITE